MECRPRLAGQRATEICLSLSRPQTCTYSHIWLLIDMSTGDLNFVPHAYAVGI